MIERTCTIDGCDRPHHAKGLCKPCYRRDYYQRNAEREKQAARDAYETDRQRARHLRLKDDPDYQAVRKAAYDRWRAANPEAAKAATDRWRARNADHVKAVKQAWIEQNPERWALIRRANNRTRKLRKRSQAGPDPVDYNAILEEHGMWCYLCETEIPSLDDLHMDHVIPLSKGGLHAAENIRPTHAACNMRKGARLLD